MSEKPILFTGPMVRAIRTGRKTQTRRIVKLKRHPPTPGHRLNVCHYAGGLSWDDGRCECQLAARNPYGWIGDRLWVRETWTPIPTEKPSGYFTDPKWVNRVAWYAADNDRPTWGGKWRPSIHMPRWASRITLEITGVRVEKLHDISEDDARAEGMEAVECYQKAKDGHPLQPCRTAFAWTWNSIHGDMAWAHNPWVWVIEFKRLNGVRDG